MGGGIYPSANCLVSQNSFDQKDEELSPTLDPPSYFELGAPDVWQCFDFTYHNLDHLCVRQSDAATFCEIMQSFILIQNT